LPFPQRRAFATIDCANPNPNNVVRKVRATEPLLDDFEARALTNANVLHRGATHEPMRHLIVRARRLPL
jgi:hypothetical protein